jgi:hypothetical protein
MNTLFRPFPKIGEINQSAVERPELVDISVGVDFVSKFEKASDRSGGGRSAILRKAVSKSCAQIVRSSGSRAPELGAICVCESSHIEVLAWRGALAYVRKPALKRRVGFAHLGGDQEQHPIDAEARCIECASVVKFDDRRHEPDLQGQA